MAETLILGASGQLGTALTRRLDGVVTPTHHELDLAGLTLELAQDLVASASPGVVINCAAWTAVDAAEDAEAEATAVNGTAVGLLAETADRSGIPFVTFSTDYVFDGTSKLPYRETDPTGPINAYGRSKLVGEQAALQYPRSLVIRTSWVQSATHPCFIRTMLDLGQSGDELRVVSDQTGRPTFADDLAAATLEALEAGVTGLLHVANEGSGTWHDLASASLEAAGSLARVTPVTSDEFPTRAKRPTYSVLDTTRYRKLGLTPLPLWRESLEAVVDTITQSQ